MLDLSDLVSQQLTSLAKGIPHSLDGVALSDVEAQALNILRSPFPTPVAVVRQSALQSNIDLMAAYTEAMGVELAPHGKTTMCPQIFERQLKAGAWGMTCATSTHLRVYRRHRVPRIIMANQLLEEEAIDFVANELDTDPQFEFYAIVDSVEGVRRYHSACGGAPRRRRFNLLVEVGAPGGRTGARTTDDALRVVEEITSRRDVLRFAGIEAYEGIFPGAPGVVEARVEALLSQVRAVAEACDGAGSFEDGEVILSAGGSGYFDLVAASLTSLRLSRPTRVVLRSGCYVTHDHGFYAAAVDRLRQRPHANLLKEMAFDPALEVWATVQSVPEPGLALLTLGKRDVSFDLGLPIPLKHHRPNADGVTDIRDLAEVVGLNDHHGYLRFAGIDLVVGDLIGLGISHPCTTFDRWQHLYLVDDRYDVVSTLRTFF